MNDMRFALAVFCRLLESRVDCTLQVSNGDFSVFIEGNHLDTTTRQALIDGAVATAVADELRHRGVDPDDIERMALALCADMSETVSTVEN